ncbi:MAG TPA: DNA gyrase inhibitor YacG [Alphaproteobacteria bacterium]
MADRVINLSASGARRRTKKCPICGRPPEPANAPFCSRRCADEDLRRWLSGEYRIPSEEAPDPDGAAG